MVVRVGVIGAGVWGAHHMNAARQLEEVGLVKLVSMAASSQGTVDRVTSEYNISGYTDYREMIQKENLDTVTIVTPDHLHREMTIYAIKHGLHVLVEKPMDVSVEGCKEMIEAAENSGVLLEVDFHKRFDPYVLRMKQLIKQGRIGDPQYAYAYMEDRIDIPAGTKWASESSPFWFLGTHKVDLLRFVLGDEVESVFARGHEGKLKGMGIDTLDSTVVMIEFSRGTTATINVCWILPESFETPVNQGIRIIGTEGALEVDTQDRGFRLWGEKKPETHNLFAHFALQTARGRKIESGYYVDGVLDFFQNVHFLKKGGSLSDMDWEAIPSGFDGLKATEIAFAVEESLKKGEIIRL